MDTAYLAAGCFWGVERAFSKLEGVLETKVGYMGGNIKNPTYEQVCSGKTDHAETVKVIFDSKKIPFSNLLDVFWTIHDPTTLNRQGLDIGTQYRSIIFYIDDNQKKCAEISKKKWNNSKKFKNEIITEINKAGLFFEAEEYHQKYLEKR